MPSQARECLHTIHAWSRLILWCPQAQYTHNSSFPPRAHTFFHFSFFFFASFPFCFFLCVCVFFFWGGRGLFGAFFSKFFLFLFSKKFSGAQNLILCLNCCTISCNISVKKKKTFFEPSRAEAPLFLFSFLCLFCRCFFVVFFFLFLIVSLCFFFLFFFNCCFFLHFFSSLMFFLGEEGNF